METRPLKPTHSKQRGAFAPHEAWIAQVAQQRPGCGPWETLSRVHGSGITFPSPINNRRFAVTRPQLEIGECLTEYVLSVSLQIGSDKVESEAKY